MGTNYSQKDFRNVSFTDRDLAYLDFTGSDLRGADFSGANLRGASLVRVKLGMTTLHTVLIFLASMVVSALSGYIAMLAGHALQAMLSSKDANIRDAGILSIVVIIPFILYSIWQGVRSAIKLMLIPVVGIAIVIGSVAYTSGSGTGKGMIFLILAFWLTVVMFVVGTIARAVAGALSNILFAVVALFGAFFGKTMGGGIGTAVMAISCMIISKRALAGAEGFEVLRKIVSYITVRYGTSFRDAILSEADFSGSQIRNCDFQGADVDFIHWGDSKKMNCVMNWGN